MSYKAGIVDAIQELGDRSGSSSIAIRKVMQSKLPKGKKWQNTTYLTALKTGVANGDFVQNKNSYKLSAEYKKKLAKSAKAAPAKKKAAPKKKAPATKKKTTAAKKKTAPKKKATTTKKKAPPPRRLRRKRRRPPRRRLRSRRPPNPRRPRSKQLGYHCALTSITLLWHNCRVNM
jgi:histone H1/5